MKAKALFFLIATNVLGGASYTATGFAQEGFSDFSIVFLRTFFGWLIFLPFLIPALPKLRECTREQWLRMAAVGTFGYAAPLILGTVGQKMSSATNGALMIGVEPVSIVLLSALFLGERLSWLKSVAAVAGFVGVAFIVFQGPPWEATLTTQLQGDLLLFSHAICWSLYSVIGKPIVGKIDPMLYTGVTTAFGLLPITIFAMPSLLSGPPVPLQGQAIAGVLFLAIGVTFLATWFWNKALEIVPASQLASFIFLQPLVGALIALFLRGESFSFWSALGGACILAGVFLSSRAPSTGSGVSS